MVSVPTETPVTNPLPFTVAEELLLFQVPPAVISDNCVVLPTATVVLPVIGATIGAKITVMAILLLVTVGSVEQLMLLVRSQLITSPFWRLGISIEF